MAWNNKRVNPNRKLKSKSADPDVQNKFDQWRADWNLFIEEVLLVNLDPEQKAVVASVQQNPKTVVSSGTARGKDFVAACIGICFFYLTPQWDEHGVMIGNTKVIMTAPTDRQVGNIMYPEITRLFHRAKHLPGRLVGYDIRTDNDEWFLTGFKADEKKHEAWTGLHAVNILFIVTEASGVATSIFNGIEGNLQGNSRLLLVLNDNTGTGYASDALKSPRWAKFRLDSLQAPNVLQKKIVIPGQVDYTWVKDKVETWCMQIRKAEMSDLDGDFEFEGKYYRPNDLFRVKVRGLPPKVSSDVLVPMEWLDKAVERWKHFNAQGFKIEKPLRLGSDIAGMGRDSSCDCHRFGDYVKLLEIVESRGTFSHMESAGRIKTTLKQHTDTFTGLFPQAFIDTIGEGAGVYSRLLEMKEEKGNEWMHVHSCKFSEAADDGTNALKDITGQYEFVNMRAYLYWCIRDWLNPSHNSKAMLPKDEFLFQELTETKWKFRSDGRIIIEEKEEIRKRIKRSPDRADALANTFYPAPDVDPRPQESKNLSKYFF